MKPAHVILAILDAFPHDHVGPDLTPTLWSLAKEGGRAPDGGRAVLAASTYPNHATFVSGALPGEHGMFTNKVLVDGELQPAEQIGPAVPTLFDLCRDTGRRAIAAFGDQNLVGVCGAGAADTHWPPDGELPKDAPRGRLGYGADRAVADGFDSLEPERADLIVLQLDEVDTMRHLHGPDAPESLDQCRATDAVFGELLERMRPEWDETVVIALSDHDQEAVNEGAIDLQAEATARGLDVFIAHEGTAAVVTGEIGTDVLLELPGVTGTATLTERHTLVWGDAGQQFGIDWGLKAQHGSPRTAKQMAIVGGGHPAAGEIARQINGTPPAATVWAGLVAELLGLSGQFG
jgi:predicted AlkP superfamily pyrophosphatase or phosphodiesterase